MKVSRELKVASAVAGAFICVFALALTVAYKYFTRMPNTDPYLRVEFVAPSIGFIVGSRLLQTTDGGKTWRIVREGGDGTFSSPLVVESLHRFQFVNQEVGMTLGRGFLRKTSDGGGTWNETWSIPMDDEYMKPSFFFITPKEGWLAGKNVYHTVDGGQNWERLAATPTGDPVHQQQQLFISPDIADYQPVLWFHSAKDGVMAKLDGMVQLTKDGGKTWQYVFDANMQLTNMFFVDNANGWIVGYDGYVARTQDGGHSWTFLRSPTSAGLFSIHFVNANSGCAVGEKSTIICTKDAGTTWNFAEVKSLPEMRPILASVSFTDELNGWAVGGLGNEHSFAFTWRPSKIALTTKDGGQTWEPVNLPH